MSGTLSDQTVLGVKSSSKGYLPGQLTAPVMLDGEMDQSDALVESCFIEAPVIGYCPDPGHRFDELWLLPRTESGQESTGTEAVDGQPGGCR